MLTRRPTPRRPRRGFSLIEILVVISIIGVLSAISAGALFRLRAAQTVSNTEGTLSKLHGLMMTRWSSVAEQAKKTVPSSLVDRCGDKERATVVWTYATFKNEFPMTFAEARVTVNFGAGATLLPRGIFLKVANDPAFAGLTLEEQSAALFYAGITQGGNGGNAAGADGSNQQVGNTKTDGTGAAVYKDGWGMPVFFLRHASGGEINGPPYSRANKVTLGNSSVSVINVLDPRGLVSLWPTPLVNPWLGLTTLNPPTANGVFLRQELERGLIGVGAPLPIRFRFQVITTDTNTVPTLVSGGANKLFGADPFDVAADDSADNLLSYRLRREGDKGN